MMNERNVPELRFPEFSGEWEEKKLGDIAKLTSGGTPSRKVPEYWNGFIPWVTTSDINEKEIKTIKESITEKGLQNSSAKVINEKSIIVAMYGQGKTRGKASLINLRASTNQACAIIRTPNDNIDYVFQLIKSKYTVLRALSNNGSQKNLSLSLLKDFKLMKPSLPEQKKIGNFLNKLDRLIELEEKKLELLEEQKKGYMQKIFSQELRFKDENGNDYPEWEQKSFSEILEVMSGKDYKHLNKGEYPVYGTGGHMTSVDNFLYKQDAIGIGRKGTIDNPQYLKGPFWTVDTLFYCIPKNKMDIQFVFNLFEHINWKKYDESTGVPSLSKNTIYQVKATLPSFEEQRKIGDFFNVLTKKIDIYEDKIKNLYEFKKEILRQMFA